MVQFYKQLSTKCCAVALAIFAYVLPLTAGDIQNPQLQLIETGSAFAAWDETNESGLRSVQFTQKTVDGPWATPQSISLNGFDSFAPQLLVNNNGDAVCVWMIIDPTWGITSLSAAKYDHTTETWTNPAVLSSSNELVDQQFCVQFDNNGNIVILWKSYLLAQATTAMYSTTSSIGGSWTTPVLVSE